MESIIYQYLCEQMNIEGILATYADVPAVFNTFVPDDMDENWNDAQYPRCVFELNMQADPERKISGQLIIDVMCENESTSVQPEELETIVKAVVDGCFFSTDELTISVQWNSSDNFSEKDNKLSGITLSFDVLAYPVQETESPDPVKAVNLWLKTLYQDAYVIGRDALPQVWKPSDDSPAIYCSLYRLGESPRMKSTANVDWFGAELHVNIMAPSENVRSTICRTATHILTNSTRIMLDDGSPMLIDKINTNLAADPLRAGQIQINATYGVLPHREEKPLLQRTFIYGLNAEREV